MATKSPRLRLYDAEKAEQVNPETLKLWNKYKIDMELRELSEKTQDAYKFDLFQWWIFVLDNQDNKSVTEIDEDDLTEFFYSCKVAGNNSRRMRRRMSSVAAFYKFLRKKKIVLVSPMEYIDRPAKDTDVLVQTYLTEEQIAEMKQKLADIISDKNITDLQRHQWMTMRAYALFSLSTMARVNAVRGVAWKQIDFDNRVASQVVEKEGYVVDLYFSKETKSVLEELKRYRKERGIDDGGYLFAVKYGDGYNMPTASTLNIWCKKIGSLIGVETLHPHDWRHSAATLLKNRGMALEDVSALLHHAGTDVTRKHYIKEDARKLQSAKDDFEAF